MKLLLWSLPCCVDLLISCGSCLGSFLPSMLKTWQGKSTFYLAFVQLWANCSCSSTSPGLPICSEYCVHHLLAWLAASWLTAAVAALEIYSSVLTQRYQTPQQHKLWHPSSVSDLSKDAASWWSTYWQAPIFRFGRHHYMPFITFAFDLLIY